MIGITKYHHEDKLIYQKVPIQMDQNLHYLH